MNHLQNIVGMPIVKELLYEREQYYRHNDAARSHFFGFEPTDYNAVVQGTELHLASS